MAIKDGMCYCCPDLAEVKSVGLAANTCVIPLVYVKDPNAEILSSIRDVFQKKQLGRILPNGSLAKISTGICLKSYAKSFLENLRHIQAQKYKFGRMQHINVWDSSRGVQRGKLGFSV